MHSTTDKPTCGARPALTFGSLFAGVGGFDLGFEQAGMRCAWQVEYDSAAAGVLAYHWPTVPRRRDVRDSGAANLAPVDVICGGFPCQDLSVAGNRAGLSGTRSGLFYEMTRIADELRPAVLVWENVPGLLSSDDGRDFARVLMELERVGYCGAWTTLDAQFFGVAQRRQRVFGVFARRDIGAERCAEILSLAARLPWNTPTRRAARTGVAAAIRAGSSGDGVNKPGRRDDDDHNIVIASAATASTGPRDDGSDNLIASIFQEAQYGVAEYTSAGTLRAGRIPEHQMVVAATLNSGGNNGGFRTEPGEHIVTVSLAENQRGELRTSDVAAQLTSGGGKPGQGYPAVFAFTERTRLEGRTFEAQEDLAYALTNPGSGGRTHSRQIGGSFGVRRLTPRECERLQGFPDDWTARTVDGPQADSTRYRQMGNAVCVTVSRWLGCRIVEIVEQLGR